MARKKLLTLALILIAAPLRAEKSPNAAFWWSFFVPGGGYFYQGETAKGLSYLTATGGMIGWGLAVDKKKESGEVNAPFVYAQQIHGIQIYLSYREALRKSYGSFTDLKILKDRSGADDLALAPFKKENLISPWVLGFAALGVGVNYLGARLEENNRDFWDIKESKFLGDSFSRNSAFAVHSAYWIPISLGAATSEESIFRGLLQSGWEESMGKRGGLLAASAVFGLAHYNGTGPSASNAAFAALAGMYLGWRYQERDYHLSEGIASHFWFDVFSGITIFLADPKNNALGAKMEFALQ